MSGLMVGILRCAILKSACLHMTAVMNQSTVIRSRADDGISTGKDDEKDRLGDESVSVNVERLYAPLCQWPASTLS